MENPMRTVVCPNCGANATNLHNCDFCGSYLVQKAALGIDMKGYLQNAKEYYSAGVEKIVQYYCSILGKHNLSDGLDLYFEQDDKVVVLLIPTSNYGISMRLFEPILSEKGLTNKFKNSNVFAAFNVSEATEREAETGEVTRTIEIYESDFGTDYAGAALVVNQLLRDVFQISSDDVIMSISGGIDAVDENGNEVESHFARYNKNGVFIYGRGDGKNQFETIEGIKFNLANKAEVKDEPSLMKKLIGMNKFGWTITAILIALAVFMYLVSNVFI